MSTEFPIQRAVRQSQKLNGDGVTKTFGPFEFKIWDVLDVVVEQKLDGAEIFARVEPLVQKITTDAFSHFTITFLMHRWRQRSFM
ncbi:MAG: hypothetical protein U5K75_00190 [Ahrensia sp.]|nr:hypothetical protein [Ahrensia sp.]